MPDIEAIEVLQQAKDRIFDHGWGRGTAEWRAAEGDYESHCLEDALCGRRGAFVDDSLFLAVGRSADYLRTVLGVSRHLWLWNDQQKSATPVLNAIDEAIMVAKGSD